MGCGKSKHAVQTATTLVKSSDGSTTTTKTVKETAAGSSLVQKQVETKTTKETLTTKVDPNADNVLKQDLKVNHSDPNENADGVGEAVDVVKDDEKVKDLSPADVSGVDNVVHASSKGDTEAVKEDEGKRESGVKEDNKTKTDNVVPPTEEDVKMKETNVTKDNKTKAEFMTPTSEDVVGPFEVVKGDEAKDSKEENKTTVTSDVKTIDGSSNPKGDNLKVDEQKLVANSVESTKVETKKASNHHFLFEDVEVTKADIAKAKISPATETEKVPIAKEASVAIVAQEKEA
ncbi:hypothetical protein QVD17_01763 [Tagetes erecta]|uniref:Uncharacterized protein n=1 Tax=Tagetes erecta TaxID=13708 RepID=A0AAD8L5F6_TARER|nr:hypothetical protein QVD17_01763 [Tagetes erecta]